MHQVGAGVIGLYIAHQLLQQTQLSVTLIDRQQPCAGATGAGQGYIWMAHRAPDSPLWELAARSRASWERFVLSNPELATQMEWQARQSGRRPGLSSDCFDRQLPASAVRVDKRADLPRSRAQLVLPAPSPPPLLTPPPPTTTTTQTTGSLLLATTASEMTQLEARASMLQAKGVEGVRLLVRDQVLREEPALGLPPSAAGLLVESDGQIVSDRASGALVLVLVDATRGKGFATVGAALGCATHTKH